MRRCRLIRSIRRALWERRRFPLSPSRFEKFLSFPLHPLFSVPVCQSIDIRNAVRHFSRLKGCRLVEGFVQILLIDNAESSEYTNISFPELREITGYLLLYRYPFYPTLYIKHIVSIRFVPRANRAEDRRGGGGKRRRRRRRKPARFGTVSS